MRRLLSLLAMVALAVAVASYVWMTEWRQPEGGAAAQTMPEEPVSEAPANAPGPYVSFDVVAADGSVRGAVTIDLYEEVAPGHAERIATLAETGAYEGVAFHRVIDGFMAQTGDVEFGVPGADYGRAGGGGSSMPDLAAEFSDVPYTRGIVGMARGEAPNSANSQFFIMFDPAPHLNGSYTVVGEVTEGMEAVDAILRGGRNGAVMEDPDRMTNVTLTR